MFEIVRYTPERASEWNAFVTESKNGTFLFDRNYMDYHSDRFIDHSLMFYHDGRLFGLLPANVVGSTLQSHMGLTYGGLIMNAHTTASATVALFEQLNEYLRGQGIDKVLYKCVPWIYHQLPAQEDLYAIFRTCKARLAARDIATTIVQEKAMRWERVRRRGVKRASDNGLRVERSEDYASFWKVLDDNLGHKYSARPVHTVDEIVMLHNRFPENIVLYNALKDDVVVGGIVVYVTPQVVHAQYSSATPEGKKWGAIDAIYDRIINHDYKDCTYFDFGKSTEERGNYLNDELIFQKEGFGGRGICYDWYEWEL